MIFQSPRPVPDIPVANIVRYIFDQAKQTVFGYNPDTPVIIDARSKEQISFTEVERLTYRLASGLQNRLGITKGAYVGVYANNDIYALPIFYSTALIGGVLVPTFPQVPADVLAYRMQVTPPKCIFTTEELLPIVREAMAISGHNIPESHIVLIRGKGQASGDPLTSNSTTLLSELLLDEPFDELTISSEEEAKRTLLVIPHTSGSTGRPKGMLIPHYSLIAQCACEVARDPFLQQASKENRLKPRSALFTLFQTQAYGLYFSAIEYVCRGITTIEGKMFDIQNVLSLVDQYKPSEIRGIPKIYYDWIENFDELCHYDTSSLKGLYSTGIIFAPEMKEKLERLTGLLISSEYGTSESMGVARNEAFGQPPYAVGTLYTSVKLKVIDEQGKLLGPNELGEICVKTLAEMLDYTFLDDGSGKARKPIRDSEGYFYTGDLGMMTEDGVLRVFERVNDTIKGPDGYVFPSTIENKLQEHPDVADVVVLGVPSPHGDNHQVARAFIVLSETAKKRAETAGEQTVLDEIVEWANSGECSSSERLGGGAQAIEPLPIPRGDKGRHLIVRMRYVPDFKPEEPVVAAMISPLPGLQL